MSHLRKEGGAWLRELRQASGVSQRSLSKVIGLKNHGVISQIESGRGRIPPSLIVKWAQAVNYPVREFAIQLIKYYEPTTYELIFSDESWQSERTPPMPSNIASPADNLLTSMQDRMDRLEKQLAKFQR